MFSWQITIAVPPLLGFPPALQKNTTHKHRKRLKLWKNHVFPMNMTKQMQGIVHLC